jgi:hypothetical protein
MRIFYYSVHISLEYNKKNIKVRKYDGNRYLFFLELYFLCQVDSAFLGDDDLFGVFSGHL